MVPLWHRSKKKTPRGQRQPLPCQQFEISCFFNLEVEGGVSPIPPRRSPYREPLLPGTVPDASSVKITEKGCHVQRLIEVGRQVSLHTEVPPVPVPRIMVKEQSVTLDPVVPDPHKTTLKKHERSFSDAGSVHPYTGGIEAAHRERHCGPPRGAERETRTATSS